MWEVRNALYRTQYLLDKRRMMMIDCATDYDGKIAQQVGIRAATCRSQHDRVLQSRAIRVRHRRFPPDDGIDVSYWSWVDGDSGSMGWEQGHVRVPGIHSS